MTISVTVLFNLNGSATHPDGSLLVGAGGNLLGTTQYSNQSGYGVTYELTSTGTGYASSPTVLAGFDGIGSDGAIPTGGVIADAQGDLFGTTAYGGTNGDGTVYEIVNTPTGYASGAVILANFNGTDGSDPQGGVAIDANGDLFGTTTGGGSGSVGTVFELARTPTGYATAPTSLVSFDSNDGGNPIGRLIIDANGDLLGTTQGFGAIFHSPYNDGTVFEISNTPTGYATMPTTLATFDGTNGSGPGNLTEDAHGNLFGATTNGGTGENDGTLFEIVNTPTGYASAPTILYNFYLGTGNAYPNTGLLVDASGNLFGTAAGSAYDPGTVFELANTGTGYASAPTTLVNFISFNGTDEDYVLGDSPATGLATDGTGDLFGTTQAGGSSNAYGTIFEITGSGFVASPVTCFAEGSRIDTARGEVAVEALRIGDLAKVLLGGNLAPVIWIGRRQVWCRQHPRPEQVWPVRVKAGAFGSGAPRRDLWLSPNHAVFINGMLIPVKYLINGTTIAQVPRHSIVYYHVELPRHDVIWAEGLPTESYLDTGDRWSFDNADGAIRLSPEFSRAKGVDRLWEAYGCAPMIVTGPALDAARQHVERCSVQISPPPAGTLVAA